MTDKNFILHLTLLENIGPAIIQRIMDLQRSGTQVPDLYLFSSADWQRTCGFSAATAEKLADGLACDKVLETELDLIAEYNIQWATVEEETYPHLLREIYLPPAVIYWQGSLSALHGVNSFRARPELVEGYPRAHRALGIVGARKANGYGEYAVNAIVPNLVAAQYTIVSGGAMGIDAMAHAATIKNGGKTIAVLGSGLLKPYPTCNRDLFKSIVKSGGCMVSSFPLNMEAMPGHFPARNRIITGLSRGCLVVQAAKKSGALISAHYAMEQGREVFAVPGLIGDELSAGCNALIQSGAKLVTSAADILEEFGDRIQLPDKQVLQEKAMQMSLESFQRARSERVEESPRALQDTLQQVPYFAKASSDTHGERKRKDRPEQDKYSHYSETQKTIIAACKQSSYFDAIVNTTQLTTELVQSELFNLQLDGVVSQDFTGMWTAL